MPSNSAPGLQVLVGVRLMSPERGAFPFTRQRQSTETTARDTKQRTFKAQGDLPARKSSPRACAPSGYMDHLQIQDSGSHGDGIILVSTHDLFRRGDGFRGVLSP